MSSDPDNMRLYDLTPAAEADLGDIARYTLRQWGVRQQRRYESQLLTCLRRIAENKVRAKTFTARYPQVQVTRCQQHYVFFLRPEGQKPLIIAVLHGRMDMLARLETRLP